MAYCEISHDDEEQARQTLGETAKPTGRLRWYDGMGPMQILQSEWTNDLGVVRLWYDVPTMRLCK
jgi:hypothetical protein